MMPAILTSLFAARRASGSLPARVALGDGRTVLIRPVQADDAARLQDFVRALTPLSRRQRFHVPVAELPEALLRHLTQVDHVDHVALLAEAVTEGVARQVGEARWIRRADDAESAEFAIAVADDYQGSGLGGHLLDRLEASAAAGGVRRLVGDVLRTNTPMVDWLRARGWHFSRHADDPSVTRAELRLAGAAARWREAA